MNFRELLFISVAGSTLALGLAGQANAQTTTPDEAASASGMERSPLNDIVVTARKRAEAAQDIPLAITSFGADDLADRVVTKAQDLPNFVPGLRYQTGAIDTAVRFALRGQVSSDALLTIAPAVGIYLDSGNVPHPIGLNGSLFDIQRVEVLKGPQGTLYGRNTTGGAINFITRGADFDGDHGYVTAEVGNYRSLKLAGAMNVVLADDVLALRVAAQHWKRDGIGKSLATGQRYGADRDDQVYRASLLFTPNDRVRAITKLEHVQMDRGGNFVNLLALGGSTPTSEVGLEAGCATSIGNITPTSPLFNAATAAAFPACAKAAIDAAINTDIHGDGIFRNNAQGANLEKAKTWHAVEDVTFDLSDDVQLRSITTYHRATTTQATDYDGSPYQVLEYYGGIGGALPSVSNGVQKGPPIGVEEGPPFRI